jgi:heme oxygenase
MILESPQIVCPPLRDELRAATAELHEEIDRCFHNYDLSTLRGYRAFLEASAAALLPVEQGLQRVHIERVFPDWPARRRRDAIVADLERLDGTCEPLPEMEIRDFGSMLGAMYVLEGSRLGAKALLRIVSRSPDPRVRQATAYLAHGERQPLWQKFLHSLQCHSEHLTDTHSAIASARQVFALFGQAARRNSTGLA